MILLVLGAFFVAVWAFVSLAIWLNPPLQSVPPRKDCGPGREVTITGRPIEIMPLEQFTVTIHSPCTCRAWFLNPGPWACTCPPRVPFTPTVDLYVTAMLEGLLLRGICGDPGDTARARGRLERDVGSAWRQAGGVQEGLDWEPGKLELDVNLGGGFPPATHHDYWRGMSQKLKSTR